MRYIRHHGHEYGVTEQVIAAFGISSGAHLVLMLALEDGPGDPESADEVERHSSKIDVVSAFAGPTDLTAEDWVGTIGAAYVTSFTGSPHDGFSGGAHAEASPLTHVDGDDPPVLLLHGDADQVVPVGQARTLAASLYMRVIENPVARWSTYDAKKLGVKPPTIVPATIQERVWTTPIWYTPTGDPASGRTQKYEAIIVPYGKMGDE